MSLVLELLYEVVGIADVAVTVGKARVTAGRSWLIYLPSYNGCSLTQIIALWGGGGFLENWDTVKPK
jgi:hypothetical protein